MTKIVTTHLDEEGEPVKNEMEVAGPGGFTIILHPQGLKVDVPEFVEIDPQDTIRTMSEMTQNAWEWISTGEIFQHLWEQAFDEQDRTKPPPTIAALNMTDMGHRHIAGMIVMGCEACIAGRSIFFRNPETYLHPRNERIIMRMFKRMLEVFGKAGKVQVKGYTRKDGIVVEGYERTVAAKKVETDPEKDKSQTLEWLQRLGADKEIADLEGRGKMTAGQMYEEVFADSDIGVWFIAEFVKLRDGDAA